MLVAIVQLSNEASVKINETLENKAQIGSLELSFPRPQRVGEPPNFTLVLTVIQTPCHPWGPPSCLLQSVTIIKYF